MKSNLKKYTIVSILFLLLIAIITNSEEVMHSSLMAIDVWKRNIFPALFPLFVIADLLINYDFITILGNVLYKPMHKLFGFNKGEIFIFFISMLSGFPSSSKYSSYLYKKKLISLDSANRMLMCSHFSNPLFIFGTIYSLFPNKKLCLFILISHYLGNFMLAFFTKKANLDDNSDSVVLQKQTFTDTLFHSISNNTTTLLFILSSVSLFFILTTIIKQLFPFNNFTLTIISGIFEMTQGIKMLSLTNISLFLCSILITFFISFGGISVHLQTIGMLSGTELSYKKFFKGRIIHSFLSSIFIIILLKLFY